MNVKVIDNFLSKEEHHSIVNTFISQDFSWYLSNDVTKKDDGDSHRLYYFTHLFFHNVDNSPFYKQMIEDMFIKKINFDKLLRVKANLYPGSNTLNEHEPHRDYDYSHKGAIYYVNSNDGYTKIGDKKIESVANRMMFFDPYVLHSSTDCTNDRYRMNINFNYV